MVLVRVIGPHRVGQRAGGSGAATLKELLWGEVDGHNERRESQPSHLYPHLYYYSSLNGHARLLNGRQKL